jgi:uncharacterized membrane protein YebE (DUF533 family)
MPSDPTPSDPTPSDPTPSTPLASLEPSQRALLRIVCWVAWADGDFAEEERTLLQQVVARTLAPLNTAEDPALAVSSLAAENLQPVDVEQLVADLEGADGRQQAVKLAVLMMGANQRPQDDAAVNPAEKSAYRRLLAALALPEAAVQEAEWAARQELQRPRSLGELISETLAGFGAWPAHGDTDLPLGYWL